MSGTGGDGNGAWWIAILTSTIVVATTTTTRPDHATVVETAMMRRINGDEVFHTYNNSNSSNGLWFQKQLEFGEGGGKQISFPWKATNIECEGGLEKNVIQWNLNVVEFILEITVTTPCS